MTKCFLGVYYWNVFDFAIILSTRKGHSAENWCAKKKKIWYYMQNILWTDFIWLGSEVHGVKTESSKCLKEGESLYLSGHVTGVQYHRISPNINYCFVRAVVCRQKAVTQDPYCTWVILHKRTGDVESAYCTCPAGYVSCISLTKK